MSNHMPEVAKMLGVEIGEKFEVEGISHNRFVVTYDGLRRFGAGRTTEYSRRILHELLNGSARIRPLPRYTIPEDLPVDSKVWVRNKKGDEWLPRHLYKVNVEDEDTPYLAFHEGRTSHSGNSRGLNYWKFCITDEDYQRRKKEAE